MRGLRPNSGAGHKMNDDEREALGSMLTTTLRHELSPLAEKVDDVRLQNVGIETRLGRTEADVHEMRKSMSKLATRSELMSLHERVDSVVEDLGSMREGLGEVKGRTRSKYPQVERGDDRPSSAAVMSPIDPKAYVPLAVAVAVAVGSAILAVWQIVGGN